MTEDNDSNEYAVATEKTNNSTRAAFEQKLIYELIKKIRTACSRLEQLIFKMIDLHNWRCMGIPKRGCKFAYT
jgi:hypothetical protein